MSRTTLTGTRIRERRMVLGLRQAEVARDVGISPSYLNLIEHNRRRIGGKLLVNLARVLEVEASALTEGAQAALLETMRDAAGGHDGARAELDRVEELAGRFPGWASLLADRHARVGELERTVEVLSDRMTHDPFLSASLHEMLSAITSIRSAAAILAETDDLDVEWQARFHRNLHDDSRRLAEGAAALVGYLDEGEDGAENQGSPQEEVETFLKARGYHLPELEVPGGNVDALLAGAGEIASTPARELARRYLDRYASDAERLPKAELLAAMDGKGIDAGALARQFGVDAHLLFRRLAAMPADQVGFDIGLVVCDGSGTLTFRKPVAGFAVPRFGAACPLWPLYQALSRPMSPMVADIELAARPPRLFRTYAICQPVQVAGFGGPQVLESAMLILPQGDRDAGQLFEVGTSCRICPRKVCPARREPSILADGL